VMHTEPRSSISSSPKHCRYWPTRRRLVTRHRCHSVKQRLGLATQTTIDLARIKRTASATAPRRPIGNAAFACRAAPLERLTVRRTSTKDSSATSRIVSPDWQPCRKLPPSMNAKFDSVWQSSRPNQAKFVAIGSKLVYLDDCSGGNSRPLHPSGVGGGHFLSPKWDDK